MEAQLLPELIESSSVIDLDTRVCIFCICEPKIEPKYCVRCNNEFCSHFASKTDFQFCVYCLNDIILEDSIITKEIISKSLNGKKEFRRTMRARHLVFKGQDWMFAQARINTLSDEELQTTIEYHREIFDQMIGEAEARKIAKGKLALSKANKAYGASLKIPSKAGFNTDGSVIGMESMTVTTTKVTKTRVTGVQTNNMQVALTAIMNVMRAQGLTDEQIKSKLIAMSGGVK